EEEAGILLGRVSEQTAVQEARGEFGAAPDTGLLINFVEGFIDGFDADLQMGRNLEIFLSLQAFNRDLGFTPGEAPGVAQMLFVTGPAGGRSFDHRQKIAVGSQHALWQRSAMDLVGNTTDFDISGLK